MLAKQQDAGKWTGRHRLLGNLRLAGAGVGLLALWTAETYAPTSTWYVVCALVAGFFVTTHYFQRFEQAMAYAGHAAKLYEPVAGSKRRRQSELVGDHPAADPDHAFARDVDILGKGGLVEHLNLAATQDGVASLVGLLARPSMADVLVARQAAIKELRPKLDLREELFVAGFTEGPSIRTGIVRQWASQAPADVPRWLPVACLILAIGTLIAGGFTLAAGSATGYSALGACLLLEVAVWKRSQRILTARPLEAEQVHQDFDALGRLVRILESEEFHSPVLRELSGKIRDGGGRASDRLGRLSRLVGLYESRRNQFVAILGPLVLYSTQVALATERWRAAHAARIPDWIDAIGELEAYSSLSCFAFENPLYAFPQVAEDGPNFNATGLAHPLLPANAVANDVSLDGQRQIMVVSGANMAGKSTLLRTIGTNMALAYAGAPVRATSLQISPLTMIASIRVQDSLLQGKSRFAAELDRIRRMLETIRTGKPTIVLIDELLAGTNSFDRFAGAVALSEFILDRDNALAVLSTHDRNVTRWAERNSDRIGNVHFRDVFDDGEMTFDYQLHAGPALRGNAVELMKRAGLPIPENLPAPQSTNAV